MHGPYSGDNINELLHKLLEELFFNQKEVEVRGKKTLELHPCIAVLNNPLKRTLLYPGRGNNPFATLAETMWVLAGRSDVEWLKFFLPRAPDFSDDGEVWRSGYGPRIRNWSLRRFEKNWHIVSNKVVDTDCNFKVDQVKWIVAQLQKDLYTRQAVISIWDPAKECTVGETKDYPCNDWIHFMVRDGKLDCEVVVRSNDVLWGFSAINLYEWTVLQEIIAGALDIEVGKYYHYTSSMHIYEDYFEKGKKLVEDQVFDYALPVFRFCEGIVDINNYLSNVEKICEYFEYYTGQKTKYDVMNFLGMSKSLTHIVRLLECFCILKRAKAQDALNDKEWERYHNIMDCVPFTDLKVSCYTWVMRNFAKKKGYSFPKAISELRNKSCSK